MNPILTAACLTLQLDPSKFSAPMMLAFRRDEASRGVSVATPALTAAPQALPLTHLRDLREAGQWSEIVYGVPGARRVDALCGELTTEAGTVTVFAVARGAPGEARYHVDEIRHDPAADAEARAAYFRRCVDVLAAALAEAAHA